MNGFAQVPGADAWRFLMGNTLLRMLGHLQLSDDQIQHWQALAMGSVALNASTGPSKPGGSAHARAGTASDVETGQHEAWGKAGAASLTEEARGAQEMLMVMLPEICMRQAPVLTCAVIREWKSEEAGPIRQGLAGIEIRHASANAISLQV